MPVLGTPRAMRAQTVALARVQARNEGMPIASVGSKKVDSSLLAVVVKETQLHAGGVGCVNPDCGSAVNQVDSQPMRRGGRLNGGGGSGVGLCSH